jgi:hypothetical protein
LFKAIEGLVEMKNFLREPDIDEPFRLIDVDVDVALAVQEGVLTIDMQDVKVVCCCNCEDNANGIDSNDGGKGLVEVQTCDLGVPLYNDSRFVLLKVAFGVTFDSEYPFDSE